jgi:pentatricopeptide repeat protein
VVTDKLIIELFHWPSLDRNKRRFDNSFVLEQFYAILETCNYRPGERVFQQIISSALRDLQKEARPARAKLAHKAMTRLKTEHPFFEVSPSFLNLCLKVCEGTGDLYLAADTLSRAIQRSTGDYFLNNFTSSTTDVSYHDIAKTLRLCAGDSNALDSVVSSIQSVDHILPLAGYRLMMEQIIRNFAALGKPERSMQILQSMVDKGISPSEDAYGIVIQGFAPKNPQEALRIFDSIESPGPSAYNGLILSQVCSQAWDDVIATFSSLIAAGINPLPTSYHGVLLSYYRKDPEQARAFLYDIADQKIDLPTGSYKLAASILLGLSDDSDKEKRLTIDNLRDKIKDMNADNPHVKKATLNVMRSLRMAEQEEKREPSGLLTGEDIRIRRRMAWNEFLLHLVEFSKVTT